MENFNSNKENYNQPHTTLKARRLDDPTNTWNLSCKPKGYIDTCPFLGFHPLFYPILLISHFCCIGQTPSKLRSPICLGTNVSHSAEIHRKNYRPHIDRASDVQRHPCWMAHMLTKKRSQRNLPFQPRVQIFRVT